MICFPPLQFRPEFEFRQSGAIVDLINTYKGLSSEKLLELRKGGDLTESALSVLDEEISKRHLDSRFIEETHENIKQTKTYIETSKLFYRRLFGGVAIFLGILSFCIFLIARRDEVLLPLVFLCLSLFFIYYGMRGFSKRRGPKSIREKAFHEEGSVSDL